MIDLRHNRVDVGIGVRAAGFQVMAVDVVNYQSAGRKPLALIFSGSG